MNNLSEITKYIMRLLKRKGRMEMKAIVKETLLKFSGEGAQQIWNSINNNCTTSKPRFQKHKATKTRRATYSLK